MFKPEKSKTEWARVVERRCFIHKSVCFFAFSIGGKTDGIGPSSYSFNVNKLLGYTVLSQISKCVTLAPLPSDFNGFWFPLRVIRISGFVGAVKGAFPVK